MDKRKTRVALRPGETAETSDGLIRVTWEGGETFLDPRPIYERLAEVTRERDEARDALDFLEDKIEELRRENEHLRSVVAVEVIAKAAAAWARGIRDFASALSDAMGGGDLGAALREVARATGGEE